MMERHWERFAGDINIDSKVLKKQLITFCHKMVNQVEKTYGDFSKEYEQNELAQGIILAIKGRAKRVLKQMG